MTPPKAKDDELDAVRTAYQAFASQPIDAWPRMLGYLSKRLNDVQLDSRKEEGAELLARLIVEAGGTADDLEGLNEIRSRVLLVRSVMPVASSFYRSTSALIALIDDLIKVSADAKAREAAPVTREDIELAGIAATRRPVDRRGDPSELARDPGPSVRDRGATADGR